MVYTLYRDKKAETLCYTEKEQEALKILCANKGVAFTSRELNIAYGILISLVLKSKDPRPMAKGFTKIIVYEDRIKTRYYSETGFYFKEECVFWVE